MNKNIWPVKIEIGDYVTQKGQGGIGFARRVVAINVKKNTVSVQSPIGRYQVNVAQIKAVYRKVV